MHLHQFITTQPFRVVYTPQLDFNRAFRGKCNYYKHRAPHLHVLYRNQFSFEMIAQLFPVFLGRIPA